MPNEAKKMVVIRNGRASAVRLGGSGIFAAGPDKLPDNGSTGISGGAVLMPGTNEVDAELWANCSKWPAVAGMVEEGDLEVLGPDGEPTEFHRLKEPAALKAVRNCFVPKQLEAWSADTKSARVKKEIAEQLRMLNEKIAAAKKASKKAEDGDREEESPEA